MWPENFRITQEDRANNRQLLLENKMCFNSPSLSTFPGR